jgi:FAD:protein FMN transferase
MAAPDPLIRRARPLLGTFVEIAVPARLESAIEAGFAAIARIHRLMSFHEDTSDLAKLRAAAPKEIVAVAPETVAVLRIAADLHLASGGLFDVTVGRQLVGSGFLPRHGIGHLSRYSGTANDIEILDDYHIRLHRLVLIDLGGIAKGYAVDQSVAALQAVGVKRGIVNAGGDLRIFGDTQVPVETRMAGGGLSAPLFVANTAVASSENSRLRRRIRGTVATPHIGYGSQSIVCDQTVTIIAKTCVIADAMTKIAMSDIKLADLLLAPHQGHVIRYTLSEAA